MMYLWLYWLNFTNVFKLHNRDPISHTVISWSNPNKTLHCLFVILGKYYSAAIPLFGSWQHILRLGCEWGYIAMNLIKVYRHPFSNDMCTMTAQNDYVMIFLFSNICNGMFAEKVGSVLCVTSSMTTVTRCAVDIFYTGQSCWSTHGPVCTEWHYKQGQDICAVQKKKKKICKSGALVMELSRVSFQPPREQHGVSNHCQIDSVCLGWNQGKHWSLHYWPFVGESTGDLWFSSQRAGKV